ncbi:MAG: preprotein translocase subunit SecA, partial [Leucobacter sp.]|nr:preprotein translocase subunit SecA [Leucobacter sp.]
SGRQGDPGESRFYLSLADDLMRLFNAGAAAALMNRSSFPDELAIESKMVTRAIQSAQSQVEQRNSEIRKNVLKYDDVLDRQRKAIYTDRSQILDGEDIESRVDVFREQVIDAILDSHGTDGNWDLDALWNDLKQIYPIGLTVDEVVEEAGGKGMGRDFLRREILSDSEVAYRNREASLGEEAMRELERRVVLSVIDRRWRDHLYEMEYLKEGIGLRAMAQRDPLVEYQREGFTLFQSTMGQIKEESMGLLYNLEVQVRAAEGPQDHVHLEGGGLEEQSGIDESALSYSAPDEEGHNAVSGAGGGRKPRTPQAQRTAPAAPPQRGAFGQVIEADEEAAQAPQNRAMRRAKKK